MSDWSGAPREFTFGPFLFSSTIDLPELRQGAPSTGWIHVTIRRGEVPQELAGGTRCDDFCSVAEAEYLLNIPGVARFYVAHGSQVQVQPYPEGLASDLSAYLLGSVFGALCHQNGLLPLHASAVAARGRVTAFLGDSGAGKSTLAACLQQRGQEIVADDICLLAEREGEREVVPVAGWLKLWRPSLEHLQRSPEERDRVFARQDKFRVYLEPAGGERLQLQSLVFLVRAEDADEAPRLEALSTVETLARMMEKTYLAYALEAMGGQPRLFRQCARVLATARGYQLMVPWDLRRMEEVLNLLERDLLGRDLLSNEAR